MQLKHRFYRLPITINSERLQREMHFIDSEEWINHPNGFVGNSALPLVSVNGEDNHEVSGPMAPCPRTAKMPYLMKVLASLNTVIGRTRLMRISAGSGVPRHCDTNLYWRKRMRIHIPITTNPSVIFESDGQTQHMAAGEVWVMDTWHNHSVVNQGEERIHLVVDTIGSLSLWSALENQAWKPKVGETKPNDTFITKEIQASQLTKASKLTLEKFNSEIVLHPSEIKEILTSYLDDLKFETHPEDSESPQDILTDLMRAWQIAWISYGVDAKQHMRYKLLTTNAIERLKSLNFRACLKTNKQTLDTLLLQFTTSLDEPEISKTPISHVAKTKPENKNKESRSVLTFEPIFIVSAPRSGSTLLYETLGAHEQLRHYDGESHQIIESIPSLSVAANGSNQLMAKHATQAVSEQLKQEFINQLSENGDVTSFKKTTFLEKTPKNSLRVSFLKTAFPNARFIYLYRQPQQNISSIIDGWKSRRFVTYKNLAGWNSSYDWSFLLPEGWRYLPTDDLATIASYQYRAANQAILNDFSDIPKDQKISLNYESFIQNPEHELRKICLFLNLPWSSQFDIKLSKPSGLQLSKYTLEAPDNNKWLKNKTLMQDVMPEMLKFYNNHILGTLDRMPSDSNTQL